VLEMLFLLWVSPSSINCSRIYNNLTGVQSEQEWVGIISDIWLTTIAWWIEPKYDDVRVIFFHRQRGYFFQLFEDHSFLTRQ
jgi:hypothetical protein